MSDDPIEPSMSLLQWREQCCAWNAIIAALFFDIIGMFGTRVNGLWSLLFKGTAHTKCRLSMFTYSSLQRLITIHNSIQFSVHQPTHKCKKACEA